MKYTFSPNHVIDYCVGTVYSEWGPQTTEVALGNDSKKCEQQSAPDNQQQTPGNRQTTGNTRQEETSVRHPAINSQHSKNNTRLQTKIITTDKYTGQQNRYSTNNRQEEIQQDKVESNNLFMLYICHKLEADINRTTSPLCFFHW